jgi:invasion protein IalB
MFTMTRSLATITIATLGFGAVSGSPLTAQQPPVQSAPKTPGGPPPAVEQTFPGGASQLQETHGDWRVVCAQKDGQKACTFSQQQTDNNSRQLVLGIELKPTGSDRAEGTMILPFGLAVTKPVTLQIDDAGPTQTAQFRTCLPVGCLVPITFDASTVASLRKGTVLTVKTTGDGGQEAALKVSLKGFPGAFDRTAILGK